MTNSNSIYPQEGIAQDSIQMQSELARQMNSSCEIGTLGKYVVMMSLADLKEIANVELRAYSEKLEHENGALQYKLDRAVEALKFYANSDCYTDFGSAGLSEIDEDGGEWAQKVLEEIEDGKPR